MLTDVDQLDLDGLRIAYRRAGDGPPVMLLHGFVGDSREWRPEIEELSDEFTVVAWDAPGSGGSSDPPETFRLADFADCLAAFIDVLGLGSPHVVGLSFGGALALELYRRHPTLLTTLVLASAFAGWTGSLPAVVVEQRLMQTLRAADRPPADFVRAVIPSMFSESPPAGPAEEFANIMVEIHPAGFRVMARALAEADLRDVLPKIKVPTLLLYGDKDVRAPLTVARDLHAAIPGSRLAVMSGVGHMSSVEAAGRFAAEVRTFLRSVQL